MLPAVRAAIHTLQVAVPPSFARPFYSLTAANPGALAMLPCVLNLSCLEFFFFLFGFPVRVVAMPAVCLSGAGARPCEILANVWAFERKKTPDRVPARQQLRQTAETGRTDVRTHQRAPRKRAR